MNQVDESQPLISHLVELRNRLLRCVICVAVIFVSLVYFSNDIYHFVASPLTEVMPKGATMIATNIQTPFFTPIKLTAIVSIFISVPYLLYQIWAFIAPALYQHEKRMIYPLLFSSTILFYCGVAFAYYVVFPFVFGFFTQTAPEGVAIATDISSYLDFALALFLAFGVCFEVPIAIILLCWTGVTTVKSLSEKRPYIIVAAFFIGMILTPPDVFSQTLLAVPMWLLFEVGLLVARFYQPKDEVEESAVKNSEEKTE
ncbi:twin-arginine translocase subunit TatC [Rodentibacter heidelbergensis]|uniref:Sec-independent protein translocase protein TatC n=1 Tax=Rodentibacter heidelbergensis TaxID=1908258 RepID=A0A1V3I8Y5_9PAST|nr:twin-arginine translocase subunit TatC [Rodentibacter heidelbergensis]OOF36110.1 twin arginine-targeting protein translocase TatC [Rodentibacter heidelbergensis]